MSDEPTGLPRAATTVHIAIGNSDDRLTQAEWARFHADTDGLIRGAVEGLATIHGAWVSNPVHPWQNACWSFTVADEHRDAWQDERDLLRDALSRVARTYRQDSVAWTEGVTVFIEAAPAYPIGGDYRPPEWRVGDDPARDGAVTGGLVDEGDDR